VIPVVVLCFASYGYVTVVLAEIIDLNIVVPARAVSNNELFVIQTPNSAAFRQPDWRLHHHPIISFLIVLGLSSRRPLLSARHHNPANNNLTVGESSP